MEEALRIVRGFTLYANDSINLALDIDEMELPPFEEHAEAFQPGGSDMEVEITGMGLKALTAKFKLKSHSPEIIGLFGGAPGVRQNWTGKKLVVSEETGTEHEHAIDIVGRLSKLAAESLKGGKVTGYDHEIKSIWTYTEYWDGRPMHRFSFKKGGWDIRNFVPINTGRRRVLFS